MRGAATARGVGRPVRGRALLRWPAGVVACGAVGWAAAACVIDVTPIVGATGDGGSSSSSSTGSFDAAVIPTGSWVNVTANLANISSECGNMAYVSAKPDEDQLIAGIALKGLWSSRDNGASWQSLGAGAGSATITNVTSSIVYDPNPSNTMRYWESGIYNGGGVYGTLDDGVTFTQLGSAYHIDQVSIDFSDPARQTLLAGGHESARTVYLSKDGGATWVSIGAGLPASAFCVRPLVIDPQTYLVGCYGGSTGIYRTTDSGSTWVQLTSSGGTAAPLVAASDGSIYWASANGGGLTRSTDQGAHWTDVAGSAVVASVHPIELPDGRVATLGAQYVLVSSDHGASWTPASSALPYSDAIGVTYSAQRKAFFIWHATCGQGQVPVPADGIMRFDFDYQAQPGTDAH